MDEFLMWPFDHLLSGAVSDNVMILGPQFAFSRWGSIQKVQKVIKEDIQFVKLAWKGLSKYKRTERISETSSGSGRRFEYFAMSQANF